MSAVLLTIGAIAAGAGALGSLGMGIAGKAKGNKNAKIEAIRKILSKKSGGKYDNL